VAACDVNGQEPPVDDPIVLPTTPPGDPNYQQPVLRNTLLLTAGQIVGIPLSILANAVTARYLGPAAVGYMYIGATFNSFAFLAVEWGQYGVLPALVATDRSRAGRLLGTSLVWRSALAIVVYGVLVELCQLLGYDHEVRVVVTLFFVGYAVSTMSNACQSVIIGYERIEVAAYRQILEQIATLLFVVPILMLGGRLHATLLGHAAATVVAFLYIRRALRATRVGRLSVDLITFKTLLYRGTPFVFMTLAMVLQPAIDAVFLSKLASANVVGWHSAARRLVGFLIFPASALVGALYPTLCRLHATDSEAFRQTTSGALRGTSLLVVPIALGCLLYPDLGIALYDRTSFRPAEDNLRVLSLFVFLLYFTMPLGTCILAAGRQRAWTFVQSSCVIISLVLDPLLVPWFQQRTGNGGLGICAAAVLSEIIVLSCGLTLVPRGIFDRRFWRSLLPVFLSGLAMVVVARVLKSLTSFVAAPVAVTAYVGCLWVTGGLDRQLMATLLALSPRLSRLRQT
jgi:O-antigen/teichoic acid export membrane protein